MVEDCLLERFPMEEIYTVHNMPGIPAGHFWTRPGGIMASEDNFVIEILGRGTHAARPHMGATGFAGDAWHRSMDRELCRSG